MDALAYDVYLTDNACPPPIGTVLRIEAGESSSKGIKLRLREAEPSLAVLLDLRATVNALWEFEKHVAEKLDALEKLYLRGQEDYEHDTLE